MSGLIYMNASGLADSWITGTPSYSYYLTRFKRHSKFSFETVEKKFKQEVTFDSISTCEIPTDEGDLIQNIALLVELNSDIDWPTKYGSSLTYRDRLSSNLIEYIELVIGGQVIERITGQYIFIYESYNNSVPSRTITTSTNLDSLRHTFGIKYHSTDNVIRMIINLPFYFYRNPKLSIPACSLHKHSIEVRLKTNKVRELYAETIDWPADQYGETNLAPGPAKILNASLYVNYAYISEEERNFLMSRNVDQVITQTQVSSFLMPFEQDETKTVRLNFKHPVRELVIHNRVLDFKRVSLGVPEPIYFENVRTIDYGAPIKRASLKINNANLFDEDGRSLMYLIPERYKKSMNSIYDFVDDWIGFYSFSEEPDNSEPSGQINMSRIINQEFTIQMDRARALTWGEHAPLVVYVYAINYNILSFNNGLCGLKYY
jgi:hypothetical protein